MDKKPPQEVEGKAREALIRRILLPSAALAELHMQSEETSSTLQEEKKE